MDGTSREREGEGGIISIIDDDPLLLLLFVIFGGVFTIVLGGSGFPGLEKLIWPRQPLLNAAQPGPNLK